MMKSFKRMSGMLAVILAAAIFINNESIVSALAPVNGAGAIGMLSDSLAGDSLSGIIGTQEGASGGEKNDGNGSGTGESGGEKGEAGSGPETGDNSGGTGEGSGEGSPETGDNSGGTGEGSGEGGPETGDNSGGTGEGSEEGGPETGDNSGGTGEGSEEGGPETGDNSGGTGEGSEEDRPETGEGGENSGEITDDTEQGEPVPEHEHIFSDTQGQIICTVCGMEKQEEEKPGEEGDSSQPVYTPCIEGRSHEYLELPAEDGMAGRYRCIFCAREIDEDIFSEESALLHGHIWERSEGVLLPSCTGCLEEYHDCDAQEGYGIHIFELIQTEGENDRYRCMMCGEEKENLESYELTAETFMEIMGISMLMFTYEGETSSLPTTIAELRQAENNGSYGSKTFLVENLADVVALSRLNQDGFEFDGYTIQFGARRYADGTQGGDITHWDLTAIKEGDFNGWGTEEYPFKGTLSSYYLDGSLRFSTKVPMLNYAAAGAEVSQLQINASIISAGDPVGIIAAHVVPSDTSDTITLSKLSLSGTVENPTGAGGILFGEVRNGGEDALRFKYEDAGIQMGASVKARYAGGIAGYTEGNVEIYHTNVFPAGEINGTGDTVETGSAAAAGGAGMLAGRMDSFSAADGKLYSGKLYLEGSKAASVEVKVGGDGICGGFVGILQGGAVLQSTTAAGTKEALNVSGSVSGMTAGGIVGHCELTGLSLDNISIGAQVNASTRYAGGLIGHYFGKPEGDTGNEYQSVNHIRVTGNIKGHTAAGGIAGYVEASNFRIGTKETSDCVTVTGSVSAGGNGGVGAGGVLGLVNGQYVEVYHAAVSGSISNGASLGGIIGAVGNGSAKSVVKVMDASVSSRLVPDAANKSQGGIFGSVNARSMAALDGRIDTSGIIIDNNSAKKGHIAGEQSKALVYFETACSYNRPAGKAWVDDIGTYGGVYRNGTWGEQGELISYADKRVTGAVDTTGNFVWVLDSEADVIRLAIALNSDGNFAMDCFGAPAKIIMTEMGSYILRSDSGVFNLENSGIYSLNANVRAEISDSFSGSFGGEAGSPVTLKLGSLTTYQSYVSLFPCVADNARFSNFRLEREIIHARDRAAGLAALAIGGITMDKVDMEVRLSGSTLNSPYLYGSMFAEYQGRTNRELTLTGCRIGGSISINQSGASQDSQKQYAGGITARYTENTGSTLHIDGLDIGIAIESNSSFVSGMVTQINDSSIINSRRDPVTLRLSNITVKNEARLVISGTNATGGWLGREWYGVAPYINGNETYSVRNLNIGEGGDAGKGPYYSTNGFFGGLVHTVAGRVRLKDIAVNNGTFHTANTSTHHNGLLFYQGQDALIELDGYAIAGTGMEDASVNIAANNQKVAITGTTVNFSEIIGNNVGTTTAGGLNDFKNGGVVNIISSSFDNNHTVYRNRLINNAIGSERARYYYNLFGTDLSGSGFLAGKQLDSSDIIITNGDQMMVWHLTRYMNPGIKRYLNSYYSSGNAAAATGNITLSGTIDLDKKSYYPSYVSGITIQGKDRARIIFHGGEITEKAIGNKSPYFAGEHYMMQNGLFISQEGAVTVQGDENFLTLTGTVSDAEGSSGALFSRSISGAKNIYRIRLERLFIYNHTSAHQKGLLIGNVNDNTALDISWVETKYSPGDKKAASALIARVGSNTAENINIDFTNIKVDDKTAGIFSAATLIDSFDYTDSTEKNKGRVRYLFTEEAYKGTDGSTRTKTPFTDDIHGRNDYSTYGYCVTLGNELQFGVEHWNVDYGPQDTDRLPGDTKSWGEAMADKFIDYLPYVCAADSRKNIEVNPKNAEIIEGCGTYEDPYLIRNAKQVLTLARYLRNPDDKKYLEGWQIVKTGKKNDSGTGICNKSHGEADYVIYGAADFPARDELRQAYYMIVEDVDLSNLATATDRNIAQEFVGLGTEDMPFSGVIAGERKADGSSISITLPQKQINNSCTNFGLIQFAKGAVVKDLIIKHNTAIENGLTGVIRVTNDGGAVMACITGGDNIIDNVTVENALAAGNTKAALGGYAGTIEQGSLILRNLSENGLRSFRAGTWKNDGSLEEFTAATLGAYPYVSGLVGRVENGFVLYEDSVAGEKVLPHGAVNIAGIYSHTYMPISKTYDILREAKLLEGVADGRISIKGTADGGNFSADIKNEEQLQIVSMAINSDSFSVYYGGGGYDKLAVCRKAAYDKIGKVTTADNEYNKATKKDDGVYWYPYIYQYFLFNGRDSDSSSPGDGFYTTLDTYTSGGNNAYRSKLNSVTKEITAKMTYNLAHDTTRDISVVDYDLSGYGHGFRGLGATYRVFESDEDTVNLTVKSNAVFSDFRADFNGNGATVKAEMINDYDTAIHTVALFNDLIDNSAAHTYEIRNVVVTGSFINYIENKNAFAGAGNANYSGDRAAALVGIMKRPWILKNITALDVTVSSKGYAGGVAAWIDPEGADKDYKLVDCKVLSTSESSQSLIRTVGGSSGGILGVMTPAADNKPITGLSLTLENCLAQGSSTGGKIHYVSVKNDGITTGFTDSDQERNARGRSGAIAGHVGKRSYYNQRIEIKLYISGSPGTEEVKYAAVSGGDSTGGVLGEYYGWRANNTYMNVCIEDITVSGSRIEGKNKNEPGQKSFGVGGIIGKLQRAASCEIKDTRVWNTDVKSTYIGNDMSVGGVIGFCYFDSRVTLDKVTVAGDLAADSKPVYSIAAQNEDAGGLIGRCGISGRTKSEVMITDCLVSGMNISSDNRRALDVTGDKAVGSSDSRAAGMIGTIANTSLQITSNIADGYNRVENCIIRTGKGSAAGVAGAATGNGELAISAVEVTGCTIGSNGRISAIGEAGHGGVLGTIRSESSGSHRFKNIMVDSCYIYGKYTGGLAGYVDADQKVGNVRENTKDKIKISDTSILGYYAGGVFGIDKSGKEAFAYVEVIGNTIAALRDDNGGYSAAGGFAGRKDISSGDNNIDYLKITENRILSNNHKDNKLGCAGGMFGYLSAGSYLYSYKAELTDNQIGYYETEKAAADILSNEVEGHLALLTETMEALADRSGTEVALWKQGLLGLNKVTTLPGGMKEADIEDYALLFGNLVGACEGDGHVYFMAPDIRYTDGYDGKVRPVVDVGAATAQTKGNKLLSYPYDYRKNLHVIYHEPDTTGANTAAGMWGNNESDKNRLFSQVNVDAVLSEYQLAAEGSDTGKLLDAYRLHITDDLENTVTNIYQKVWRNVSGDYLSPLMVENGGLRESLPMIVIDTQYGTTDQLMTSVLAALTGAGAVQNSGGKNKNPVYDTGLAHIASSITVAPMQVKDGIIQEAPRGETASIKYSKQNNRMEITYAGYDTATENGDGTFSLLTLTYGQDSYTLLDGTEVKDSKIILNIPIFVIERLTIDTHFKIVEGEVYNVDSAKEKGLSNGPLLANNSSYTLYTEYIYGEARNKYSTDASPLQIDKTIGMTYTDEKGTTVRDNFWKGTKLTLIDVCDSHKVYYYTVTGDETEALRYADFKDSEGRPYVNKQIHGNTGMEVHSGSGDKFVTKDTELSNGIYQEKIYEYEDVAVERFLIVVDTSKVEESLKLNTRDIRDYAITPNLSEEILKRTTLSEHTQLQITRQPGLTINLVKSGENGCRIDGKIEDGDRVTIDGAFHIEGDNAYWARVMTNQTATIDSANHYKYLELGIYLTDKNGERVRLPDNTNVTISGSRLSPLPEETTPENPLGPYVNQSAVYFYKDGRVYYPLDALKQLIQDEMKENEGRTNGVINVKNQIILSFANADLSDYTEDGYVVHLELLRVEEPDYPAGGEVIDSYEETCPAARKTDLACALETADLMKLGVNTYEQQTKMPHPIEFDFKLDFNGVLGNNEISNQQIADKYYTVTYRIMEKINRNGTPRYIPYIGDMLTLTLAEAPEGESLRKGASSTGEDKNSVYVSYRFGLKEIKEGTNKAAGGVVTRKLLLTVEDAERMNLSNYKIQASVMVSDTPVNDIDSVVNNSLSDFFVFTIARLKTDLDY